MQRPFLNSTDQELTKQFNKGNSVAFAEIYQRYWLKMFKISRKMLKDPEMAKDAVQEVFTKLLEKRGTIEVHTTLAAFVYQGMRYHLINLIARERVKNSYIDTLMKFQVDASWETDETVRAKELEELFNREIEQLPEKMRATFNLSRNENLSYKEIAIRTGTSEGTVKKQIYYALKILRGKISVWITFVIG